MISVQIGLVRRWQWQGRCTHSHRCRSLSTASTQINVEFRRRRQRQSRCSSGNTRKSIASKTCNTTVNPNVTFISFLFALIVEFLSDRHDSSSAWFFLVLHILFYFEESHSRILSLDVFAYLVYKTFCFLDFNRFICIGLFTFYFRSCLSSHYFLTFSDNSSIDGKIMLVCFSLF
jgi:hypothetical protein